MRMNLLCLALIISLTGTASAQDNITPPSVSAPRAVLLDPKTKDLLFSKAPDQRALQGSVARLMTAYVTFWAINKGLVSLDDQVPMSLRDTQQACSCMKSKTIWLHFSASATGPCCIPSVAETVATPEGRSKIMRSLATATRVSAQSAPPMTNPAQ